MFFDSIGSLDPSPNVVGFELDEDEARKAYERAANAGISNADIHGSDFLAWALGGIDAGHRCFDAVVGNSPFIRYQYPPPPPHFQVCAEAIFDQLGCKFTKHINAWVPFILSCFKLLRPGGRLAMVVLAEIIHVAHAQSLRTYLGEHARRLIIVDPEELWFEGTLQGAVLLLTEKKSRKQNHSEDLGIYPVRGRSFLQLDAEDVFNAPEPVNGKIVEGKWTRALLSPSTRELLDGLIEETFACSFNDVAEVDVGIVTGANKFFLVDDETVIYYGLQKWAHPMFGRSDHSPGIIYDEHRHRANASKRKLINFIWFQDDGIERTVLGRKYIEQGERELLHQRYKCRIRKPWYSVPSVYSTEIGMLKRCHQAPQMILN